MKNKKPKKKRNLVVKDMITRGGPEPFKDKRKKRKNNPKKQNWEN